MRVYYSEHYTIDLPSDHRFPIAQYRLVHDALLATGVLTDREIQPAPAATASMILLAHTPAYYHAFCQGKLSPLAQRRIGFPWSKALVTRSHLIVGGALAAAEAALIDGIAGNLAGGSHHALADGGEGYCVFNDQAIVALYLLLAGVVHRIAIIDLDVHQGNGNAAILANRPEVFVFSMHAAKNYPFRKVASTLDIELPDGTDDQHYLSALAQALPQVFAFQPDIVLFQAGVDPLKDDALGRLNLSMAGLAARDQMVLTGCRDRGIPISLALGGGYAKPIEIMIDAHVQTYRIAKQIFTKDNQ